VSYTLKFEHPHFPEGKEFAINDLGIVPNGGSLDIDEDMERQFVALRGISMEDALKQIPGATLSGSSSLSAEEVKSLIPLVEEVPSENTVAETPAIPEATVAATPDTGGEM
jgi:hypothetical protein